MAKKGKKNQAGKPVIANYYDLKTDAVERLANPENAPKVSPEEIRQYTSGKGGIHIPPWLKMAFVKFWFSGAICYFFLWGLGTYITGLDLMVALAIGLGVSTDLMVNHLMRSFEPTVGAYDRWMMVRIRKYWSIFLNVLYAGVVLYCVVMIYTVINTVLVGSPETADRIAVPVEPILFGLLYMGSDLLLLTIRNTAVKIFQDASARVSGKKV